MSTRYNTESQEEEGDDGIHHPQDCQEYGGVLDALVKVKTTQELGFQSQQLGQLRAGFI